MLKNTYIWLAEYMKQCAHRRRSARKPVHIMFSVADHFEPRWGGVGLKTELERVDRWISLYEPVARRHRDTDGKVPRHTFFYPIDEYTEPAFEKIARFCEKGFGEIEIHLHHDNDTPEGLKDKIEDHKRRLSSRGLLSRDKKGDTRYGFIHGNWALDNSRKDKRWCGVNNELEILKETGCYADFTLPSAPSDTQTKKINSIYYAKDTPGPKSHNTGIDVEAGRKPSGYIMLIQGPLALNWRRRKFGILPRIENSGITLRDPATPDRVDLWIEQGICVKGRADWIFVKVYTHGAKDENLKNEYFENLDRMFEYLETKYNDGIDYKLHYVTAREMYNVVRAAEAAEQDEPARYRNYALTSNATKDVGRGTWDDQLFNVGLKTDN